LGGEGRLEGEDLCFPAENRGVGTNWLAVVDGGTETKGSAGRWFTSRRSVDGALASFNGDVWRCSPARKRWGEGVWVV